MNCGFTEKISSLIDGELAAVEAREVERHLLTCAQCAEARADFLNLRSQISGFEASLPGEVQNRALAKILAQRGTSGVRLNWGWNWGYAAVALASIVIVALVVVWNFEPGPNSVAVSSAPPVPSPTVAPSPEPEPQQPEPQQKTDTPQRQQPTPAQQPTPPARRTAPVREPKPGEQFAKLPENVPPVTPDTARSADAQTLTAMHFERAETLLRAFRNVRMEEPGAAAEVRYERARAKQLIYQNMMLRREADAAGDVQIASLLDSLEPILLDIANLPDKPDHDTVRVIRERVERKNIVALLQVNSTVLARALD